MPWACTCPIEFVAVLTRPHSLAAWCPFWLVYKYLRLSVGGEHFLHLSSILLITGRVSAKRF